MVVEIAKTEWERLHPDTGRGKYDRSQSKNEIISDGESLMQILDPQVFSGFVKENYYILGIIDIRLQTSLRNKDYLLFSLFRLIILKKNK